MLNPQEPTGAQLAAVVERFNEPYRIQKIAKPGKPEGADLLVKVLAASYCHTDAVFAAGGLSQDLPRVGCHEFAGMVVAVGPDVPSDSALTEGVHVGVTGRAYHPCGQCYECLNTGGDPERYSTYCALAGNLGLTRDGGFQEYCLVDSRQVAVLPDALPAMQAAPMMCAGVTMWAALKHERVRKAASVAILGAGGGLGHLGVQFAAYLGMQVLAIDVTEKAMGLLHDIKSDLGEVGKQVLIANAKDISAEKMKSLIAGNGPSALPMNVGVDAVLMLPEAQAAFDLGMSLLKNHGTMVVLSFPKARLQISAHDIVFRDINIVGSLVGRNHQLREMVEFVAKHQIRAQVRTYSLRDINVLVEESHKGSGGKLVVDMNV
ncbi:chaperonin 10-like protein [Aspergillus californicus]